MTDTSCFLSHPSFKDDIATKELLKFKTKQNSRILICSSFDFISSVKSNIISLKHINTYCTMGFHPNYLAEFVEGCESHLLFLFVDYFEKHKENIIGIGVCGLNFSQEKYSRNLQIKVFKCQLMMAIKHNKILYLYESGATEEMIKIMNEYDAKGLWKLEKLFVGFNGSVEQAKEYSKYNFYFGINGYICDNKHNLTLLKALQYIPLNKIVICSMSPCFFHNNFSKRINVPSNITFIIAKLAEIYNKSFNEILKITNENSDRLLGISLNGKFGLPYYKEDYIKNKELFDKQCDTINSKYCCTDSIDNKDEIKNNIEDKHNIEDKNKELIDKSQNKITPKIDYKTLISKIEMKNEYSKKNSIYKNTT
jgi:TatD DNase family protein